MCCCFCSYGCTKVRHERRLYGLVISLVILTVALPLCKNSGEHFKEGDWPRLSYREHVKEGDEEADRGNDGKPKSKSGLAFNGVSYYGKLRTVSGKLVVKSTVVPQQSARLQNRYEKGGGGRGQNQWDARSHALYILAAISTAQP